MVVVKLDSCKQQIMIYKVYDIYYLDLYKSKNKKTKDSYSRPFKV